MLSIAKQLKDNTLPQCCALLKIKIGTNAINKFLPMRNRFVFFCSIRIFVSGFDALLESIFYILVEVFTYKTL